jgi:hypothetical protein
MKFCLIAAFMSVVMAALTIGALPASADVILDVKTVNRLLSDISKLHEDSLKAPKRADRLEALYGLGERVLDLTDLMTKDLEGHGFNDPALVELIQRRLKENGVTITKDGPEWRYDLAAFREYLRLAPTGPLAADVRYALVGFADTGKTVASVQKAIADKERFIHDYPKYSEMSLVKFLLAQDHVHLARVYDDLKQKAAAERQRQVARNIYLEIIKLYPDSEEAGPAADNLNVFKQPKP